MQFFDIYLFYCSFNKCNNQRYFIKISQLGSTDQMQGQYYGNQGFQGFQGQPNQGFQGHPNQGFNQNQGFGQLGNQGFNHNVQVYILPPQDIAVHHIRNSKSWNQILQEANDWVNTNIHVRRVISISTILCHTTKQGMVTIYYDKSPQLNQVVQQFSGVALGHKTIRSSNQWTDQIKKTENFAKNLAQEERVISINQLEVNDQHHEDALTIIWFTKKA